MDKEDAERLESWVLADMLDLEREELAEHHAAVATIEAVLFARIRASGGTMLPDARWRIAIETGSRELDQNALRPLLEILPDDEVAKAFTEEHKVTSTVPAKWDGTQLNRIARAYGGEIAARIQGARKPGKERLVVERKEEATDART